MGKSHNGDFLHAVYQTSKASSQLYIVPPSKIKLAFNILTYSTIMPPKKVAPKFDNDTLVRTAVANQIDLADEFKHIWNKLDHDRLIEDMGVGNRNAASKRFKRWAAGIVKPSIKSHGDVTDTTDTEHKAEPIRKAVKKKVSGPPTKRETKREGSVPESTKKGGGKKKATRKAAVSADIGNDTSEEESEEGSEESY
ncbi:hypothetical protein OCU04_002408 [Sclerotinia nivalis]|uniref:Uncharacterized protein n=1 Tax=Sclerotinia nivalis TaxID=352851 RepID=A0A9X0AU97_9HELO|nr:hypothetical protein OCU04_002408 [Sclerotinia nivalis]